MKFTDGKLQKAGTLFDLALSRHKERLAQGWDGDEREWGVGTGCFTPQMQHTHSRDGRPAGTLRANVR